MLGLAIVSLLGAFGAVLYVLVQPMLVRVPDQRRGHGGATSGLTQVGRGLSALVDSALHRGSWSPVSVVSLELAGISMSAGTFLVTVAALSLAVLIMAITVTGSILFGLLGALIVPLIAKLVLSSRTSKRRAAFAGQLDSTLHLMASAMRAGHSLPRALDTTARESLSPSAEEFSRLINENRIGRDLVDAMHTSADRMQNEDFHWVAEAIAMQRETGGNLNEVLERVGDTIRERNALLREVHTLSAEGRGSAKILMALPVVVVISQGAINPSSIGLLLNTRAGHIALGISGILYVVGLLWMRSVTKVRL